MTLTTYPLTVSLLALSDDADITLDGATVVAVLDRTETDGGYVVQSKVKAVTDDTGQCTLALWPNTRGSGQSKYVLFAVDADAKPLFEVYLTMPESPANAADVTGPPVAPDIPLDEQLRDEIQNIRSDTIDARDAARSARDDAQSAQSTADTDAANAADSADAASTSETNASNSATAASTSASDASEAATAAAASETNAAEAADAAATSASEASDSAASATHKASAADDSAQGAANSEQAAETARSDARDARDSAKTYRDSARSAKDATEGYKDQVESVFDDFQNEYLGAHSSDPSSAPDNTPLVAGMVYWNTSDPGLKFYNGHEWVEPSEQAATAASQAQTARNEARTARDDAEDARDTAKSAQSDAADSASAAQSAENSASSSANAAATSESNASASAGAAATSESNAADSADSAATSAGSAESALGTFQGEYLGSHASAPTKKGDGAPLTRGCFYFDTAVPAMRVYDGSDWQDITSAELAEAAVRMKNLASNCVRRAHIDRQSGVIELLADQGLNLALVDHSRSSAAYYWDGEKFAKADKDAPRFAVDPETGKRGLLREPQATNLSKKSTHYPWGWKDVYGDLSDRDYALAPDGTKTADRIRGKRDNSLSRLEIRFNKSDGGKTFTLSFFENNRAKPHKNLFKRGHLVEIGNHSHNTEQYGAWDRRIYTITLADSPAEAPIFRLYLNGSGYAGSDTDVLLWGGQLEKTAYPTSPIVTDSSEVTRAADDVSIPDTSFFSQDAGTWYMEASIDHASRLLSFADHDSLLYINSSGEVESTDGTNTVSVSPGNGSAIKAAVSWEKNGKLRLAVDGQADSADYAGSWPHSDADIELGGEGVMTAKQLEYYPDAKSETELKDLTS
jgi:hypothetical protein